MPPLKVLVGVVAALAIWFALILVVDSDHKDSSVRATGKSVSFPSYAAYRAAIDQALREQGYR